MMSCDEDALLAVQCMVYGEDVTTALAIGREVWVLYDLAY